MMQVDQPSVHNRVPCLRCFLLERLRRLHFELHGIPQDPGKIPRKKLAAPGPLINYHRRPQHPQDSLVFSVGFFCILCNLGSTCPVGSWDTRNARTHSGVHQVPMTSSCPPPKAVLGGPVSPWKWSIFLLCPPTRGCFWPVGNRPFSRSRPC